MIRSGTYPSSLSFCAKSAAFLPLIRSPSALVAGRKMPGVEARLSGQRKFLDFGRSFSPGGPISVHSQFRSANARARKRKRPGLPLWTKRILGFTEKNSFGKGVVDQLEPGRQADGPLIEFRQNRLSGGAANVAIAVGIAAYFDELVGKGGMVEEVDQQAVFAVADHLANRRRIRADDERLTCHCIKQRPRQDERVGQIDMRGRDGEDLHQRLTADQTYKMDPALVELVAEFG